MIYPEWLLWITIILPVPLVIFYCIMATLNYRDKPSVHSGKEETQIE